MKKWGVKILFLGYLALVSYQPNSYAQLNSTEFGNISASKVTIPLNSNGELRFLVSANKLDNAAGKLKADIAVIDLIRKGADVDKINIEDDIYTMNANIIKIITFWIKRRNSEAVIMSDEALINIATSNAEGSKVVQVRTPIMDIDGVGFVANYAKRQVTIKQNVHIRLRFGGDELTEHIKNNTPELAATNSNITNSTEIWADSMFIDFDNKFIELIGNVELKDEDTTILTDKALVYLLGEENTEASSLDSSSEISSLERIECHGNVKLIKGDASNPEDLQQLDADFALYNFAKQEIQISGGRPVIHSGNNRLQADTFTMKQLTGEMFADGNCNLEAQMPEDDGTIRKTTVMSDKMEFSYAKNVAEAIGNVRINDTRGTILAGRLMITLEEDATTTTQKSTEVAAINDMGFAGNNKSVTAIKCLDGVIFYGKDGEEGRSEVINYNYKTGGIVLSGNQPWISQGGNRLEGREIILEQKTQRLTVENDAKITMVRQNREGANGFTTTVATCDFLDVIYADDIGYLRGNVHIQDALADVECDEMQLIFKPNNGGTEQNTQSAGLMGDAKFDKTLGKIICLGNVKGHDERGDMSCDKLTVLFKDGNDGSEIDTITADENIVLVATAEAMNEGFMSQGSDKSETTLLADHGIIDMANNMVEFFDNVQVIDQQAKISSGRFKAFLADSITEESPEVIEPEILESPELALEPEYVSEIPKHISIGETKSLQKLSFTENVLITGQDQSGVEFSARGEQADYIVLDQKIVMPTVNGVKPLLSQGKKVSENSEIEVDLSSGAPEPRGKNVKIISFDGI